VVSVSTIALISVGVIIGSYNLGYLFQNGKQRGILEDVSVGIIMSLLLALPLGFYTGQTGLGRQFTIAVIGSMRA